MSIKDIRFKRILLKLSGEALKRRDEPIDAEALSNIATQLKAIQEAGIEVGIVVGGGNFWRARTPAVWSGTAQTIWASGYSHERHSTVRCPLRAGLTRR